MTTITNAVFTVLSQKLCWKMNMLHMLVGTQSHKQQSFFKAGFKGDICQKLLFFPTQNFVKKLPAYFVEK